ncbi:MAG: hypothetical protein R2792_03165 [Saprospiraceae bacterium]
METTFGRSLLQWQYQQYAVQSRSGIGIPEHKRGFNYNDYGAMDQYYSNFENDRLDAFDVELPIVAPSMPMEISTAETLKTMVH